VVIFISDLIFLLLMASCPSARLGALPQAPRLGGEPTYLLERRQSSSARPERLEARPAAAPRGPATPMTPAGASSAHGVTERPRGRGYIWKEINECGGIQDST
jgi:hypothetical protein